MDDDAYLDALETTIAGWRKHVESTIKQAEAVDALIRETTVLARRLLEDPRRSVPEHVKQFRVVAQRLGCGIPWWSSFTKAADVIDGVADKDRI